MRKTLYRGEIYNKKSNNPFSPKGFDVLLACCEGEIQDAIGKINQSYERTNQKRNSHWGDPLDKDAPTEAEINIQTRNLKLSYSFSGKEMAGEDGPRRFSGKYLISVEGPTQEVDKLAEILNQHLLQGDPANNYFWRQFTRDNILD